MKKKHIRQHEVFCYAGRRTYPHLFATISFSPGSTFTIELLYITSSSVFQMSFCTGLTQHRMAAQQQALNVAANGRTTVQTTTDNQNLN